MRRFFYVWLVIVSVTLYYSCKSENKPNISNKVESENKILQQNDGTISLRVDKAECYHDMSNPSSNTAEWNVFISKSGRFNVWMSSSTKDTTNLQYHSPVLLSILDNRLEVQPTCDKVVKNATEVSFPYFRADSYIGTLYIQDTGLYNIQMISEKIIPDNYKSDNSSFNDSRLLSVSFNPVTR